MSVSSEELILKGINASPGICIGKAYLVDKEGVDIVARYYIAEKKLQGEIKRFKAAVKKARDEIRSVIDGSPEASALVVLCSLFSANSSLSAAS